MSQKRNGRLSIPLPFDEAIKAALEAKPPEPKPKKRRKKRAPKK